MVAVYGAFSASSSSVDWLNSPHSPLHIRLHSVRVVKPAYSLIPRGAVEGAKGE